MATKSRAYREEVWRNAKKICQLNARQVEMARALGMNPKKLLGLRPGPQQHWKLPVGKFIEACYWKRFGGDPLDHQPYKPEPGSCKVLTPERDANAPKRVRDAVWQVEDLVRYLMNLADDLQGWLARGVVPPEVLAQVPQGLREIAEALETGAPVSAIPVPPARRATHCRGKGIGSASPTMRSRFDRPGVRTIATQGQLPQQSGAARAQSRRCANAILIRSGFGVHK
jgi:hypothetical protein